MGDDMAMLDSTVESFYISSEAGANGPKDRDDKRLLS